MTMTTTTNTTWRNLGEKNANSTHFALFNTVSRVIESWCHNTVLRGSRCKGELCRDVLLSQQMLPAIKCVAGDKFIFQHDNVPTRRARETIQPLRGDTPDVIAPDLRPSHSHHLNPVGYKI